MSRTTSRWLAFVACAACAAGAATPKDAGQLAAQETWKQLELLVRGARRARGRETEPAEVAWLSLLTRLSTAHPHAEASGALAWLHLFGVPPFMPRNIDQAVLVAREGVSSTGCGRCYTLLAFLMSLGYPPVVNLAHLVPAIVERDSLYERHALRFLESVSKASPAGSDDAARLARDIGPQDPAAAAYMQAAHAGDPLGVLASAHLTQSDLINTTTLETGPNQASGIIGRRPSIRSGCDPFLTAVLGELAGKAVDTSRDDDDGLLRPWPQVESFLSMENVTKSSDTDSALVQLVLANPSRASPDDLVRAAATIEVKGTAVDGVGTVESAKELRVEAASRGHSGAALRLAVDHLQKNESHLARPWLYNVIELNNEAPEADVEMAKYYLERYVADTPNLSEARLHLERAADLGREDADLLAAHTQASSNGSANASEAIRRYRRITASKSGTSGTPMATPKASVARRSRSAFGIGDGSESIVTTGELSELQSFAAYNLGVLLLRNQSEESRNVANETTNDSRNRPSSGDIDNDPKALAHESEASCSEDAQRSFENVVLSQLPLIRLIILLERHAWRLGDTTGALLLASLLSDLGHPTGHADAAFLWDVWGRRRPAHLGKRSDVRNGAVGSASGGPCNLTGWWTTSSKALAVQNVSRTYASSIPRGGFEMFNASLAAGFAGLQGLSEGDGVYPKPEHQEFRHLHSFLWHTVSEVFPGGAPVPVALQPPGATPHLVESHHQRGKLIVTETCDEIRVEAMFVNWTFHRLGAGVDRNASCDANKTKRIDDESGRVGEEGTILGVQEFLHCWTRPEWYMSALEANIAGAPPPAPPPPEGSWESLLALTESKECPCRGAYGCRRGDGACVQVSLPEGVSCPRGAVLCPEVDPSLEPERKPMFSSDPEVCAFYYHRRAATMGHLDSMHVLSHAYTNGHRGVQRDAKEAFYWSQRAMEAGDKRGLFDVAYSLEFGLGVDADPQRAHAMYRELLGTTDGEGAFAARASSFLALLSASGRYIAGQIFGSARAEDVPPWEATP